MSRKKKEKDIAKQNEQKISQKQQQLMESILYRMAKINIEIIKQLKHEDDEERSDNV